MADLGALALFAFVSAATPGPNNVLLWAAGIQFGFRATLPHVFGISLGIGLMVLGVSAGLGALITAAPWIETTLGVIGSAFLLYLAYRIAGSRALDRPDSAEPLTLAEAVGFQFVNPKAWVFVVAAVGTFRPDSFGVVVGSLLTAATMMIVVIPSAAIWGAGGALLQGFITGGRAQRALNIVLALLLVATIAYIWI